MARCVRSVLVVFAHLGLACAMTSQPHDSEAVEPAADERTTLPETKTQDGLSLSLAYVGPDPHKVGDRSSPWILNPAKRHFTRGAQACGAVSRSAA